VNSFTEPESGISSTAVQHGGMWLNDRMEDRLGSPGHAMPEPSHDSEHLIRAFVAHWGLMARTWGINSTMGELFALLYITGTDWTAGDLRQWLGVSSGNVSMNLRELIAWGVVHKVHRSGNRRELFRAEADVWVLFRKILAERKRRELDPSLSVLDRASLQAEKDPALDDLRSRIEPLRQFFRLIDSLAVRLLSMPAGDPSEIAQIVPDEEVEMRDRSN
jgi:HTH-type transcriptional regulator, glycine betaine synthesis regulator